MEETLYFWADSETIIGYAYAISGDAVTWVTEDDEEEDCLCDLIEKLIAYTDELVTCKLTPMGKWLIEAMRQ